LAWSPGIWLLDGVTDASTPIWQACLALALAANFIGIWLLLGMTGPQTRRSRAADVLVHLTVAVVTLIWRWPVAAYLAISSVFVVQGVNFGLGVYISPEIGLFASSTSHSCSGTWSCCGIGSRMLRS
jgi:hypothetical protein